MTSSSPGGHDDQPSNVTSIDLEEGCHRTARPEEAAPDGLAESQGTERLRLTSDLNPERVRTAEKLRLTSLSLRGQSCHCGPTSLSKSSCTQMSHQKSRGFVNLQSTNQVPVNMYLTNNRPSVAIQCHNLQSRAKPFKRRRLKHECSFVDSVPGQLTADDRVACPPPLTEATSVGRRVSGTSPSSSGGRRRLYAGRTPLSPPPPSSTCIHPDQYNSIVDSSSNSPLGSRVPSSSNSVLSTESRLFVTKQRNEDQQGHNLVSLVTVLVAIIMQCFLAKARSIVSQVGANKSSGRSSSTTRPAGNRSSSSTTNTYVRWSMMLLLLVVSMTSAADVTGASGGGGGGFCDPLLCSCAGQTANCTVRGFLSFPSGLPSTIASLDLSQNDLESVNMTELELYPRLEMLNLRNNKLAKFHSDTNRVLTHLDLAYNKITSLSPHNVQLNNLLNLHYLDLSHNQITTIHAASFASGKSLHFLNLASNSIELLESKCFHQLTNLEELRLSRNSLSSFPKGVFKHMAALRVLELNRNRLVDVAGLTFDGLSGVRVLKLRRNAIKYLSDGAFYGLDSMEQLYLDRNQFRTVSKGWLYGLHKLKQLSLAFNRVDYIEDDSWDFCKELWDLDLRGNELKIIEREILMKLPSLTHLDLRDNLISHIEPNGTFSQLPKLIELQLDGNQISHTIEDTPATFKGLALLEKLTLSRNAIKSVGRLALEGLVNLRELDLSDNVISTLQDNPFQPATPRLSVLHLNSSSILCDCNIRWLPEWINSTLISGSILEGARCAHPEKLKGEKVTSVEPSLFTCEDSPKPFFLEEPRTQIALRGKDLTLICSAASTSPEKMRFTWKKDNIDLNFPNCSQIDENEAGKDVSAGQLVTYPADPSVNYHNYDRDVYFDPGDDYRSPGDYQDLILDDDVEYAHDSCVSTVAHKFDGKGMEITSHLNLKHLSSYDKGEYQCVVDNMYGATYSVKAQVTVYVFPRFMLTPTDITVQGGESATLKCSATGVPAPSISWQKDGGGDFPAARERRIHVFPETNTYVINNTKAADNGLYTCTAKNLAGTITTNITISVLESPRFIKPMHDKKVKSGENAVLECLASGSPKPRLVWLKNGAPLAPTERHFFTADGQLLIIVKADVSDGGEYECMMTNEFGSVRQTSFLSVDGGVIVVEKGPSTEVIIIAVISCIVGTSLVWLVIIYHTRKNAARRAEAEWGGSGAGSDGRLRVPVGHLGGLPLSDSGLPLLSSPTSPIHDHDRLAGMEFGSGAGGLMPGPLKHTRIDEDGGSSERDSGTGDSSKRSYDDNIAGPDIVDTVIHNFLSARGELAAGSVTASLGRRPVKGATASADDDRHTTVGVNSTLASSLGLPLMSSSVCGDVGGCGSSVRSSSIMGGRTTLPSTICGGNCKGGTGGGGDQSSSGRRSQTPLGGLGMSASLRRARTTSRRSGAVEDEEEDTGISSLASLTAGCSNATEDEHGRLLPNSQHHRCHSGSVTGYPLSDPGRRSHNGGRDTPNSVATSRSGCSHHHHHHHPAHHHHHLNHSGVKDDLSSHRRSPNPKIQETFDGDILSSEPLLPQPMLKQVSIPVVPSTSRSSSRCQEPVTGGQPAPVDRHGVRSPSGDMAAAVNSGPHPVTAAKDNQSVRQQTAEGSVGVERRLDASKMASIDANVDGSDSAGGVDLHSITAVDNPLYDSLPMSSTAANAVEPATTANCDNTVELSSIDDRPDGRQTSDTRTPNTSAAAEHPPPSSGSMTDPLAADETSGNSVTPPASVISDSVAYCGKFPPRQRNPRGLASGLCPQCLTERINNNLDVTSAAGDLEAAAAESSEVCEHYRHLLEDDILSVHSSSSGGPSVASRGGGGGRARPHPPPANRGRLLAAGEDATNCDRTTAGGGGNDEPLSFDTFTPNVELLTAEQQQTLRKRRQPRSSRQSLSETGGVSDQMVENCDNLMAAAAATEASGGNLGVVDSGTRTRRSTLELPTGETYLAIEAGEGLNEAGLRPDLGPREYRGGVSTSTLPRKGGLQQEWLEASLNYSDHRLTGANGSNLTRNSKERGSKLSLFRLGSRRNKKSDSAGSSSTGVVTGRLTGSVSTDRLDRRSLSAGGSRKDRSRKDRRSGVPEVAAAVGAADRSQLGAAGSLLDLERSDVANKSADMFD